jgi:hypothetical protein
MLPAEGGWIGRGYNPEKSVYGEEPNPTWVLPPQDTHLMSQRDKLEFRGGAATKPEAEYGNDGGKNRDHARDGRAVAQISPAFLGPSEFLGKHRLVALPAQPRSPKACS